MDQISSYSQLHRLPAEVLYHVCDFLHKVDLASLRLVSKSFAEIGGRLIVRTLYPMFSYRSLQNLLRIAEHPILSKHVRSIEYHCYILENNCFNALRDDIAYQSQYYVHGNRYRIHYPPISEEQNAAVDRRATDAFRRYQNVKE